MREVEAGEETKRLVKRLFHERRWKIKSISSEGMCGEGVDEPESWHWSLECRDKRKGESRTGPKFLPRVFEAVLSATCSTASSTTLVHVQGDREGCSYWLQQADKVQNEGERFKTCLQIVMFEMPSRCPRAKERKLDIQCLSSLGEVRTADMQAVAFRWHFRPQEQVWSPRKCMWSKKRYSHSPKVELWKNQHLGTGCSGPTKETKR